MIDATLARGLLCDAATIAPNNGERLNEFSLSSGSCQRWRDRAHAFRHVSDGGFDARRYDVGELDEGTAKAYVERHHYSGSYPASRLRYGLFAGTSLLGVAVLSVPVQRSVLTNAFPGLAPYVESLELGRFVLADEVPANGESWFLARAFVMAGREGIRGIVSFSDPLPRRRADGTVVFPGHIGTIYQASNAVYTGRGTARSLSILPDGRVLNDRALSKLRGLERGHEYVEEQLRRFGAPPRQGRDPRGWLPIALAAAGVRRVGHPGNHRYLFSVGTKRDRRGIVLGFERHAYPKASEVAA